MNKFEQAPASLGRDYPELSDARRQEFIDAKNALKAVVEKISLAKLRTMEDGLTFDLINGYDGNVNKYTLEILDSECERNDPDVGASHVIEKLQRITESLESRMDEE